MRARPLSVSLCLAVLLSTFGGAAYAVEGPHFDPAATVVEVGSDGATVVRFTEFGLQPSEAVAIAVTVTVAIETTCVVDSSGQVVFRTSSSGTASTVKTRRADTAGRIAGVESLTAQPGSVEVTGMPCEVRRKATASATVTDQDHDVRISVVS
jgi:hypothetical protein